MHATQSQLAALSNRHNLYSIVRLYLFSYDLTIIRQRLPKPPARRGTLGITEDGEEYDRLADQQEQPLGTPPGSLFMDVRFKSTSSVRRRQERLL
jgi:hypothetical protein